MLHKLVLKLASLGKAIYVFSNLAEYHVVVYNIVQYVFVHYILKYHCDRYDHVLIPSHWCI